MPASPSLPGGAGFFVPHELLDVVLHVVSLGGRERWPRGGAADEVEAVGVPVEDLVATAVHRLPFSPSRAAVHAGAGGKIARIGLERALRGLVVVPLGQLAPHK